MGQVKGPEGFRTDVEQQQEMTSLNANLPSIQRGGSLHVLTLTPFYPNDRDATNGCFISEPLDWLAKTGAAKYGICGSAVLPRSTPRERFRDEG